jgi:hypothetical protein
MDLYIKVLSSGKGLQISNVKIKDLDTLMDALPAKGLWLCMSDVYDIETAETVMKKISSWPKNNF